MFYSDIDQVIVPSRNASLRHPDLQVTNVLVPGVGHLSLPISGRIVHQTCTTLARVDERRGSVAGFRHTPAVTRHLAESAAVTSPTSEA